MEEAQHRVEMTDRKAMGFTGIKQVINYDDHEIALETSMGLLLLSGSGFNILDFSRERGTLQVSGFLKRLEYSEKGPGKGQNILQKLFK